jgi:hypothetical protein
MHQVHIAPDWLIHCVIIHGMVSACACAHRGTGLMGFPAALMVATSAGADSLPAALLKATILQHSTAQQMAWLSSCSEQQVL